MSTVDWTNLHLLPSIADRLGLIDLIRFRAVCKDWNVSSSMASAESENSPDHEPWLLLFGDNNSQCSLVTEHSTTKKTFNIPQLNGTTCLASGYGWLLLLREGSVFFFCPLSRARIDLPGPFPRTEIRNHVGIFSAPPTSEDCIVGVLSRTETNLEFHTIHRGDTCWDEYTIESTFQRPRYAGYHKELFYFFDHKLRTVCMDISRPPKLYPSKVGFATKDDKRCIPLTFGRKNEIKERLPSDQDVSEILICGTIVPCTVNGRDATRMVRYENRVASNKQGVWFLPRLHQISEKQIW